MSQNNPVTIVYSKAAPVSSCECGSDDGNFYNPPVDPNSREVIIAASDPQLVVTDQSDSSKWKFNLDFIPFVAPQIQLSAVVYASGVSEVNPVLLGKTIDRVDLTWTINKAIASQTLSSSIAGITHPTLGIAARSHSYTGLNIMNNGSFTLNVNDGLGLPGSSVSATINIAFGNYMYYGNNATLLGLANTALQSILNSFQKVVETNRSNSFFATGGQNQHFIVAYPKRFGLLTEIKKGIFVGGYIRIKNVSGVLKELVASGETESDITISNGISSESYYVYMSGFDNQNDPETKIELS